MPFAIFKCQTNAVVSLRFHNNCRLLPSWCSFSCLPPLSIVRRLPLPMFSSVRFASVSLPPPSTASKECQTMPVYFTSTGTDPLQMPEKVTQTEQQQLTRTADGQMRIRAELVELIMEELDRAEKEEGLVDSYERTLAFNEKKQGARVQLRHISQLELPQLDDHFSHCPIVLSSVHYGPGNRIALLFGFPQHEIWCSDHLGAQILIISTRSTQRGRARSIPLTTCPSTAEFSLFGELVIVGTHSGELLLLSSESGDVVWSSESTSALTHSFTVTQLRWAIGSDGRERQKELISLSLDGTVRRNRLGADNRLEFIQSANFTVDNLPRELRRGTTDGRTKLGLIGCAMDGKEILLVATETGIILRLAMDGLTLLNAFVLSETSEGIEQFDLFRTEPPDESTDEWHFCSQIIWRTSDGLIRRCPLRQQKAVTKETKILALPHSQGDFLICFEHRLLLTIGKSEKGRRELIGWDIEEGKKIRPKEGDTEAMWEPEGVGGRRDCAAVVTAKEGGQRKNRRVELFEVSAITIKSGEAL